MEYDSLYLCECMVKAERRKWFAAAIIHIHLPVNKVEYCWNIAALSVRQYILLPVYIAMESSCPNWIMFKRMHAWR